MSTVPTTPGRLAALQANESTPQTPVRQAQLNWDIPKLLEDWLQKLERRLEAWDEKHEQLLAGIITASGFSPMSSTARSLLKTPESPRNIPMPQRLTKVQEIMSDSTKSDKTIESKHLIDVASSTINEIHGGHDELSDDEPGSVTDKSVRESFSRMQTKTATASFQTSPLKGRKSVAAKLNELHNQRTSSYLRMHQKHGLLRSIIFNPCFDHFISFSIIVNALFIGVQTENAARGGQTDSVVFFAIDIIFFTIFGTELLMRITVLYKEFLRNIWNFFDATLVLLQLFEFIMQMAGMDSEAKGSGTGRVMRVFRIARIVRVVRLLRFFVQLRVMIKMIMFSLESLFWLMVLLLTMMYMVSIVFTQGVVDYLDETHGDSQVRARLKHSFGNMALSSFTLFQVITNGQSWGRTCEDVFEVGKVFGALMLLFIFFVFFSVLNVVTGVFVDGAIQHGGQERELLVAQEQKALKQVSMKLLDLLHEVDTDKSGTITLDELLACAEDATMSSYFAALQIHTPETAKLFSFLDKDGNGEIDMEEFIEGCLRLRGNARGIDLHMLMFQVEHEQKEMHDLSDLLKKDMSKIIKMLARTLSSPGLLNGQSLLPSWTSARLAANSSTEKNGSPLALANEILLEQVPPECTEVPLVFGKRNPIVGVTVRTPRGVRTPRCD